MWHHRAVDQGATPEPRGPVCNCNVFLGFFDQFSFHFSVKFSQCSRLLFYGKGIARSDPDLSTDIACLPMAPSMRTTV
jgi:hypothetical protein